LLASERKSLIRFLAIYLFSTFLLFSILTWFFYTSSKNHILSNQKEELKYSADELVSKLRSLHQSNEKVLVYPNFQGIKSAIYDLDKSYIFGSLKKDFKLNTKVCKYKFEGLTR